MEKIYYNPYEVPSAARFIKSEKGIDVFFYPYEAPNDYPFYLNDMFFALTKGDFDDIIVSLNSHNCCYYPEKVEGCFYKRIYVTGEVSLSAYTNGGEYLKDKHFYLPE